MNIVCLDMEGVLVPEIWIAFAEESGIPELRRTTRDEPDYDKLMRWRIDILRQHGLGLTDIQNTIRRIDPLPGAREFLDRLRTKTQGALGSRYDFRAFNDAVVTGGGVPMTVLERNIDAHIASRRA